MFFKLKRVLAFALVMAMTMSMAAGCGKSEQSGKVVFSVAGQDVTLDEVWFYCKSVQEYYESYYSSMFTEPDVWTSNYPATKDDGSTEETTLEKIAKRSAIKQIREIKVAYSKAGDYNVSLSESEKEEVVNQATEMMEKVTKEEKEIMGIDKDTAIKVFTESAVVQKLREKLAKEEGVEISDEEAKTSKIYYIYFPTSATDASGNAVEASAENKKKASADAEDALKRVLAGNDIATVAAAYGMGGSSGEMTIDSETELPGNLLERISKLKDGETVDKVIAAADGFYIIQMLKVVDETATAEKKEELLSEREKVLLSDKIDEWTMGQDFDYDKDVNWEYMDEIDFVAQSSVKASNSDSSKDEASSDS
ncbi:MAG: peptidyl-prolyl cis-trans isomerase [Lachnospiraceae bacterium]|nr:peptidyl-prolyl cis-trans isomerase [Lachnospiraceae bacterium]